MILNIDQELKERNLEIIGEYKGNRIKTTFKCTKCGYTFESTWYYINHYYKNKYICRGCNGNPIINKLKEKLKERNLEIIGEYKGNRIKTTFKCTKCGYTFETFWCYIKSQINFACQSCEGNLFEQQLKKKKIELVGKYKNSSTLTQFKCTKCGYTFETSWQNIKRYHKNEYVCKNCEGTTLEKQLKEKNLELIEEYKGNKISTTFKCIKCGYIFRSSWHHIQRHYKNKYICQGCNGNPIINKLKEKLKERNLEIIKDYIDNKTIMEFKCIKCNKTFFSRWVTIQQGYLCPICYPRNMGYSKSEKEIVEFLRSYNLEIIENTKEIISPLELDMYILNKKIAIEFNGLYWHSEKNKGRNYHLNKTIECLNKGIYLIHIFEDEWIYKENIIKERLKNILNLDINNKIHIGARKCIIKEIDAKIKNEFLDNYHLQGKDNSIIKLGAFYNNELISVMTFSHGNISKGSKRIENIWELNRFCSNYNFLIPGMASKFLSYFKNNYKWEMIFSYADRRWSQGNLYDKLGFEMIDFTKPNYWYFKNNKRIHRFNLRKRPDEPKDISEFVLREAEGYEKIYDCGSLKYVMKNN